MAEEKNPKKKPRKHAFVRRKKGAYDPFKKTEITDVEQDAIDQWMKKNNPQVIPTGRSVEDDYDEEE